MIDRKIRNAKMRYVRSLIHLGKQPAVHDKPEQETIMQRFRPVKTVPEALSRCGSVSRTNPTVISALVSTIVSFESALKQAGLLESSVVVVTKRF